MPFGPADAVADEDRRVGPARCFVHQQLSGPYKSWIHTHWFEQTVDGTDVEDEVVYELPFPVSVSVSQARKRRALAGRPALTAVAFDFSNRIVSGDEHTALILRRSRALDRGRRGLGT